MLLLSGFGLPAASLRPLAATLSGRGLAATIAPLGRNTDCGERTMERVLALVDIAGSDGRPPAHSDDHDDLRLGHLAMVASRRGRTAIADRL